MSPVEIARSLIGTPWVHQGRDPSIGIDCVGLLELAYGVRDSYVYSRDPHSGMIDKRMEVHFGKPVMDGARVGDAVSLGFGVSGASRHVAIIGDYKYGGLSIIHTDSVIGRVVESRYDDKWVRRTRNVYRLRGEA